MPASPPQVPLNATTPPAEVLAVRSRLEALPPALRLDEVESALLAVAEAQAARRQATERLADANGVRDSALDATDPTSADDLDQLGSLYVRGAVLEALLARIPADPPIPDDVVDLARTVATSWVSGVPAQALEVPSFAREQAAFRKMRAILADDDDGPVATESDIAVRDLFVDLSSRVERHATNATSSLSQAPTLDPLALLEVAASVRAQAEVIAAEVADANAVILAANTERAERGLNWTVRNAAGFDVLDPGSPLFEMPPVATR
jgi:hypothetical protein